MSTIHLRRPWTSAFFRLASGTVGFSPRLKNSGHVITFLRRGGLQNTDHVMPFWPFKVDSRSPTGFFYRSQVTGQRPQATGHRSQVTSQLSLEIHQQRQFKQLLRPFSFSTTSSRLIQTVWQASHMAIEGNVLLLISTFITVPMSIFTIISVLALEFLLSTFSECLFNCFAM